VQSGWKANLVPLCLPAHPPTCLPTNPPACLQPPKSTSKDPADVFYAALMRGVGGYSDPRLRPVFVVGMPRSGSTLIEQILASHSQVCRGWVGGVGWRGWVRGRVVGSVGTLHIVLSPSPQPLRALVPCISSPPATLRYDTAMRMSIARFA